MFSPIFFEWCEPLLNCCWPCEKQAGEAILKHTAKSPTPHPWLRDCSLLVLAMPYLRTRIPQTRCYPAADPELLFCWSACRQIFCPTDNHIDKVDTGAYSAVFESVTVITIICWHTAGGLRGIGAPRLILLDKLGTGELTVLDLVSRWRSLSSVARHVAFSSLWISFALRLPNHTPPHETDNPSLAKLTILRL